MRTTCACRRHATRSDFRHRRGALPQQQQSRAKAPPPLFAIIVPFREQKQQNRAAQLDAFVRHMTGFLRGRRFVILVVQQSDDGRAFNRGALLNVGFREAQRLASGSGSSVASLIFHDVDLLPSAGLLPWYTDPPMRGRPTHIAAPSTWTKYAMPGYEEVFFGGVTALHPDDFERANGFPNEYWGWGMEDDQLRLRVDATGGLKAGVLRPPRGIGIFNDVDSIRMLDLLQTREGFQQHHQMFNQLMFDRNAAQGGAGGTRRLDADWDGVGGLKGLRYEALSRSDPAVALSFDLERLHVKARLRSSKLR